MYETTSPLSDALRLGWQERNLIPDRYDSHSFHSIGIGSYIALKEGADTQRVSDLLWGHDLVMAIMEDVTPSSGRYGERRKLEEMARIEIVNGLPECLKEKYQLLFDEFLEQKTKESVIAKEADKLETLLRGDDYEKKTGRNDVLDGFFEMYEKYIKTPTARETFDELKKRHENRKI